MTTNPSAPPKAAVADVAAAATAPAIFFPVSRKKLIVLLIVTFTLYELVLFYKNRALERRRGEPVLPLMRTIFAIFFCYSLFDRVQRRAAPLGIRLPAGALAAGWILFTLAGNVLDRFVPPDRYTVLDVVVLLVLYTSVAFLVPVQNAINAINRAEVPDHDPNDRF